MLLDVVASAVPTSRAGSEGAMVWWTGSGSQLCPWVLCPCFLAQPAKAVQIDGRQTPRNVTIDNNDDAKTCARTVRSTAIPQDRAVAAAEVSIDFTSKPLGSRMPYLDWEVGTVLALIGRE
jgi:hypothetical protein